MHRNFVPFELERFMSIWENQVDYNLSESGVHPLTIRELVQEPEVMDAFLNMEMNYPQTNGTLELRDQIARYYPGATRDHVLVTTGAAQANFTALLALLDAGDEIAVMLPNYMQIWGIAKNLGVNVKTFSLKEELGWKIDVDELNAVVTEKTKLIAVCSPNNPTGHILTAEERQAIVQAAERVGAWLLADEVYAGAEHWTDEMTPSLYGDYERVLAVGSLSKAYGLPGLRIGWAVTTPQIAEELWARQDYVTISTATWSNRLAAYALSPEVRPRVMARARRLVRSGYAHFEQWCSQHPDLFSFVRPQAAAVAFVHYNRRVNSNEFVNRLIQEKKAYVVPGDHFGLDQHLRISYGLSDEYVTEGLNRIYDLLMTYPQ
jgi:aspartate/methionine/tyrosine aminotransferase